MGHLSDRELWHRCLGHPAMAVCSHLSNLVDVGTSEDSTNGPCDVYIWANQPRLSFYESDNKEYAIFSLIHRDV